MSEEKNKTETPSYCMICRRSERITGKLLDLPGGMKICSDCLQKSFNQFKDMDPETLERLTKDRLGAFTDFPGYAMFQEPRSDSADESNASEASEDAKSEHPYAKVFDFRAANGKAGMKKDHKIEEVDNEPIEEEMTLSDVLPPHKIKAALDEYIIGQDQAKKAISVGVYNHYKRILSEPKDGVEIEKSNMLMIGPTGSGKTYMVQTLARLLKVPLAMTDATSLTEAGYIGDDIESVVSKLLAAADLDVKKAEHGIIFIDEIDKIAKKKNTNQRDVSGEAVQQGLLKLLEGSKVEVPVGATNKNAMVPLETVDTSHILFICGGAFPDLEEIIKERLNQRSSMGFTADLKDRFEQDKNLIQQVQVEDLRKFGLIPEFIGRLPVICKLESLTVPMLVNILKEPKNAILKQYQRLLELDEVKLTFEEEALQAIAEIALERETGARALRSILEDYMLDIMYEIPKDENIGEVVITEAYIRRKGGPRIIFRTGGAS